MAEIMERHIQVVCLKQRGHMIPDLLIPHLHDVIRIRLVRHRVNQIPKIRRHFQKTGRLEGLVDIADMIGTVKIELAAAYRDPVVLNITELQAAHLADTKTEPDCQQTRKLNIGSADDADEFFRGREILDNWLFRGQRNADIGLDTVELQRGQNQILCLIDRLAADRCCIFVDCLLHCEAVDFVNIQRHQTLQTVPAENAVSANRGRREHIAFQRDIAVKRLCDCELLLFLSAFFNELGGCSFSFPAGRCCKGLHDIAAVSVFADKHLNPPVSGRELFCTCHKYTPFKQVYTQTSIYSIHHFPEKVKPI